MSSSGATARPAPLFYPLLIAWTILAIVPGVLVTLGIFGRVDLNTELHGAPVVLWIGGWFAQFAAFFWLMSMAGRQNFVWWFVASLVPWAIDWVAPAWPPGLLICPAIVVATTVWIALTQRDYASLEERGIPADGVVLQVYRPFMNTIINDVYIKRKVRLRVERSNGAAPYEASFNGLFMIGDIPSVGDKLALLVDPANPRHIQSDDRGGGT